MPGERGLPRHARVLLLAFSLNWPLYPVLQADARHQADARGVSSEAAADEYKRSQGIPIQVSVFQSVINRAPAQAIWFLASARDPGSDPGDSVLKPFARNPHVRPYSEAGWQLTSAPRSINPTDRRKMSRVVDKATGKSGTVMAVESITWKTRVEADARLAFWDNDTGLANGSVYHMVKTKRGWVVDISRVGFWSEQP